jgi:hypothetical protein
MHPSHSPVPAQVAACAVHRSGALLLEPHDGDALDERLQRCNAAGAAAAPHVPGGCRAQSVCALGCLLS